MGERHAEQQPQPDRNQESGPTEKASRHFLDTWKGEAMLAGIWAGTSLTGFAGFYNSASEGDTRGAIFSGIFTVLAAVSSAWKGTEAYAQYQREKS